MDEERCVRCDEIAVGAAFIGDDRLCHGEFDGTLTCYDVARVLVGNDQDTWAHLKAYWQGVRDQYALEATRPSRFRDRPVRKPPPQAVIDDVFWILRNC